MAMTFKFSDNETCNEYSLSFSGMPSMFDPNKAGEAKWGRKFNTFTITSCKTE